MPLKMLLNNYIYKRTYFYKVSLLKDFYKKIQSFVKTETLRNFKNSNYLHVGKILITARSVFLDYMTLPLKSKHLHISVCKINSLKWKE